MFSYRNATTTTYFLPQPTLPILRPFSRAAPRVTNALNNVLEPIVDRGYSRNDSTNGNQMPYLKPTAGWPELVKPAKTTESFKATPNAINAFGENRDLSIRPLPRLRDLTRNWRSDRERNAATADDLSSATETAAAG